MIKLEKKNQINKEVLFERAYRAKRDFIRHSMKKNKKALGSRKEYVKYFLNVWSVKPENQCNMLDLRSELANYHLFVSKRTLERIIKEIQITDTMSQNN